MPDFSTEIDIAPWEYLNACSRREIDELIDDLIDDGHLTRFNGKVVKKKENDSVMDLEWEELINKIKNSKHLLSNDEENIIIKIANRLV